MSAEELLKMTERISSAVTNAQAIRDKIFKEFAVATAGEQRASLLQMFKVTMDVKEAWLAKNATAEELAAFREARADDYTKLIVQESCVDEDVSPEMLMAVTNREIAGGRMTADDPIRQVAVKAAAAPHASHAEMLERARAKREGDVEVKGLLEELRSAASFDISEVRAKIERAWKASTTSDQRGTVLAMFKAVMDATERNLQSHGDAKLLEDFRKAREQDYKIFIVEECTVGLDSPGGGNVSVEALMAVTNREIAAGRMTEDHSLRKIAVQGAAAPHLSHAELVAQHAKLKAEAAREAPPMRAAPSSTSRAYLVGATLGKTLKGLFRRK